MSTKSQKTEDMLDQTFANFDSEVTGAETQESPAASDAKAGGAKKSSNMIVFIGAGVAAVGAILYLFVIKPMLAPSANSQVAQVKAPIAPQPQLAPATAEQAPAEVAPVTPLIAEADVVPTAPEVASVPDANQLNTAAVVPTAPEVAEVASVPDANQLNTAAVVPQAPVVADAPTQPAKVEAPNVASVNAQSVAVVDDLKSMFDQQTNEFKTVLTDMDSRVGTLESAITEQKDVNNKFEQRITALESNKPAAKQVRKSSAEGGASVKVTKTKKKARVVNREDKVEKADGSVLVDKSTEYQKVKVEKEKAVKEEKSERASLAHVSLHSIYGGRLWIKNTDGSLSTFSAGDKLPTGEVIKSIDDEKFEVNTDKRTLKN